MISTVLCHTTSTRNRVKPATRYVPRMAVIAERPAEDEYDGPALIVEQCREELI